MILKIEKLGSEVLREKAKPVGLVTPELVQLAEDMLETMYKAKGVGLAAEQVGRTEAMCVIDVPESCDKDEEIKACNAKVPQPLVMFDPEIIAQSGEQKGREGCLSLPNCGGDVVRPDTVTFQYRDAAGVMQLATARGFLARAVCHETDHLKGVLYIDKMDEAEREKLLKKYEKKKNERKKK